MKKYSSFFVSGNTMEGILIISLYIFSYDKINKNNKKYRSIEKQKKEYRLR